MIMCSAADLYTISTERLEYSLPRYVIIYYPTALITYRPQVD